MKVIFGFGKYIYNKLQCRLERMERRLSILKQKEEAHEANGTSALSETSAVKESTSAHHHAGHAVQNGSSEASRMEFKKRRRRGHKFYLSHQKRHKRQQLDKSATGGAETQRNQGDNSEDVEEEDETSNESGEEDEDSDDDDDQNEMEEDSDNGENGSVAESYTEQEEQTIDYPIMQTDTLYHLYYPKHACPSSPDAKRIQDQMEVETPVWRLKPMTNMYQLEGTENITDEAYYKRHQKFELEEKRRKRWDLQRLRELRTSEKLQRQRDDEMRASQDEADVETFLPSIHDLKHIEITDSLPVMAFGQPIPYVSPAEFEIPWEITNSAPTQTGRQRNNSSSTHSRKV